MEMFTRDAVLLGPPRDVRSWAVGISEAFSEATGRTPAVWTSLAGGIGGHFTWSMPIDGTAELAELTMRAYEDEAYLAKLETGRSFLTGPSHDTVYRSYSRVPDEDQSEPGHVAMVISAIAEAGSLGHAVGWGLEAAEFVSRLTGIETALLGCALGSFSRLTWMGVAESARHADEANRVMNADDEYRKLIARGGGYFKDGTGRTQFFLRIG